MNKEDKEIIKDAIRLHRKTVRAMTLDYTSKTRDGQGNVVMLAMIKLKQSRAGLSATEFLAEALCPGIKKEVT